MLEIKHIRKTYVLDNQKHEVLKDVNLSFRKSEFVSILGPSGSGKTTLLNIIGGLDSYDDGDLLINGKSTDNYKDKDWDNYRNNKIGFIFQNYNLIHHLSVFENVKIALTISGMSENDIKTRCLDVLKNVGLLEQIHKKPNQLSGGQMQRVAIARALVNNPEIIVADEPTGALDSNNSIEVMEILKDISKNKLVIMVTHNATLAEMYASRIINIEDGKIISDSNKFEERKTYTDLMVPKQNNNMPFKSAILLSFYNLLTKKKRTILTSFACSIGIIGIALVLSLSNGVNKYIKDVETNSIKDYPITINRKVYSSFGIYNIDRKKCVKNKVCIINEKSSDIITNNIRDFKNYIDINNSLNKYVSNISYSYDIDLNVYNKNYRKISNEYMKEIDVNNYNVLYGRMPKEYDEIVIVVDKNKYLAKDVLLFLDINETNKKNYTYNEILNTSLKIVINTDFYKREDNSYVDYHDNFDYVKMLVDNGQNLKIVGIVNNNESGDSFIGYSDKLNKYLIDNISATDIYKEQMNNMNVNVINNKVFDLYDNTYDEVEKKLGLYDLNNPSQISIYAKNYKSKEKIINVINNYNKKQIYINKIKYSDMMKSLVDNLSNILNIISYILIGFASISLLVSSIMIAIITYISVLERTREIGILRAIGASKKDIKRIFNCETIIEGFLSGLIAIFMTLFISTIINIIVRNITDIKNISMLSISNIFSLIILSVVINLLAGLKPANEASHKNPVDALRFE